MIEQSDGGVVAFGSCEQRETRTGRLAKADATISCWRCRTTPVPAAKKSSISARRIFASIRLPLVRVTGKSRKQRTVPLLPAIATLVRSHLEETHRSASDMDRFLRNPR